MPKGPSKPAIRFAEKFRIGGLLQAYRSVLKRIARLNITGHLSNLSRLKDKKTGADQVKGAEGRLQDPAERLALLLRDVTQHGLATVSSEVSTGKTCKAAVCGVWLSVLFPLPVANATTLEIWASSSSSRPGWVVILGHIQLLHEPLQGFEPEASKGRELDR